MADELTGSAELTWPEPRGGQTLYWDHVHFPRPFCQLGMDFLARWMSWGSRSRVFINGYAFQPHPSFGGFQLDDYRVSPDYDVPDPTQIWEEETLPYIQDICYRVRHYDYEAQDVQRLVALLPSVFSACGDAMRLTMNPFGAFNARTARLLTFCEKDLGESASLQVVTMLQGMGNVSAESGAGLSRLADRAADEPELAAAIRQSRFEAIETLPRAEGFRRELSAYLNEFGWRAPTWAEIHVPTWAEDPTVPLSLIRRYLIDPEHSPARAIERSRQLRDAAVAETEARLPAEKRSRFRVLLQEAEAHVPVCEARAMWQLISCGISRIPALIAGRKLVEAGLLECEDDIFHLRLAELTEVAAGATEGVMETVAARRADIERQSRVLPPFFLGHPPAWRVRTWYVDPGADQRIVSGVAASKGIVTARARIIRSLADADRLQSGDILVCPSTAPPWTPMFAFASAVVTDAGGILSHSAIAAREYGIPAVVGTQVATQRIPDGATVTVDGARGTVRIEQP